MSGVPLMGKTGVPMRSKTGVRLMWFSPGDLFAGGVFSQAGGISTGSVASWTGSAWVKPGNHGHDACTALGVWNKKLISGTGFFPATDKILQYDGTAWSAVGSWTGSGAPGIKAIVTWQDDLAVIGQFGMSAGNPGNRLARWNGSTWSALGGTGTNNPPSAAVVWDDQLVVCGISISTAGGVSVSEIAAWNGTVWTNMGGGLNNNAYALTVWDGKLIAGGQFTLAGGVTVSRIAAWDGEDWLPLGDGFNGTCLALTVWNGKLVAGGDFTEAGGSSANRIASWDGSSWSTLGTGLNAACLALAVYKI